MRNKIILAMAAAGMMYGVSAFAADTPPTSGPFGTGVVTFRGTITNAPCDIAVGDDKLDVDFGQISYKNLKTPDTADDAHAKSFTIHLQNCEFDAWPSGSTGHDNTPGQMSKVQVVFSGNPASGSHKAFIATNNASLGVQLQDAASAIIDPADTNPSPIQLQGQNTSLIYTAKLMNVGAEGSVKPGAFSIPVNYTLKYQ
ncbi:TPA: fimbrial protein StdA [Salmonella enterica]|nr:fimbrial protein StdA [Salmonella enterica]